MSLKILIAAILFSSVSCLAETGGDRANSSTSDKSTVTTSPSTTSTTKESSKPAPTGESDKKPPMVDYCKKHTC